MGLVDPPRLCCVYSRSLLDCGLVAGHRSLLALAHARIPDSEPPLAGACCGGSFGRVLALRWLHERFLNISDVLITFWRFCLNRHLMAKFIGGVHGGEPDHGAAQCRRD